MAKKAYGVFFLLILSACLLTVASLFITSGTYLLLHDPRAIDFLAFYTGALLLFQDPKALYDLHMQLVQQQQLVPAIKSSSLFLPFLNPPFVVVLFMPLLPFGLLNAYALWIGIQFVLLIMFCLLSYRQLTLPIRGKVLFVLGSITFLPILTSILLGQLSIILCLIFLLGWILIKKGYQFRGGLMLSLLLIKPHFLLVPFLAFLVQRNMRVLAGMLSGMIILFFVSACIVGWEGIIQYIFFLATIVSWETGYGIDLRAQHSLQTIFLIFFQTQQLADIRSFWMVSSLALIIPTLFLWVRKVSLASQRFSFLFALLIVVTLLTSPHTHFHDLSLLLVVALIMFTRLQKHNYRKMIGVMSSGYLIVLLGYAFDLYTKTHSRLIWIMVSVTYLLFLWFFFFRRAQSLRRYI